MRHLFAITCLLFPLALVFSGCTSTATEQEKADFNKSVLNQENVEEQEEVDQTIAPGYQDQGAGQVPDWEMPAQ